MAGARTPAVGYETKDLVPVKFSLFRVSTFLLLLDPQEVFLRIEAMQSLAFYFRVFKRK